MSINEKFGVDKPISPELAQQAKEVAKNVQQSSEAVASEVVNKFGSTANRETMGRSLSQKPPGRSL